MHVVLNKTFFKKKKSKIELRVVFLFHAQYQSCSGFSFRPSSKAKSFAAVVTLANSEFRNLLFFFSSLLLARRGFSGATVRGQLSYTLREKRKYSQQGSTLKLITFRKPSTDERGLQESLNVIDVRGKLIAQVLELHK